MASAAVEVGLSSLNASTFLDSSWFFQTLIGQPRVIVGVAESLNDQYSQDDHEERIASSLERWTSSSDEDCFSNLSRSSSGSSSRTCCLLNRNRNEYSASEMKRVFETLDENNDGLICYKDLHKFTKRLGYELSEEEAMIMLKSVDHNNDNCVDFDEFYTQYKTLSHHDQEEAEVQSNGEEEEADILLEAFRVFDKNQDGFISAHELQTVLLDLGFPEGKSLKSCERMIERVDSDGNGEVDITEFMTMMHMCSNCFQV